MAIQKTATKATPKANKTTEVEAPAQTEEVQESAFNFGNTPDDLLAAIQKLAETATVKQTAEQVFLTALRQGVKVIEKRRKKAGVSKIEKAKQVLKEVGIEVAVA